MHGGIENGFHFGEFVGSRLTRVITEHGDACLRFGKVAAEVQADAAFFEAAPEIAELFGRDGSAAFATNRGGDAFHQFIFGEAVLGKRDAGLIHHVDPAGRNVAAMRIDFRAAVALNFAQLYEAAILDGDVGEDAGIAGAIEHAAAANDDVVLKWCRSGGLSRSSHGKE